MCVITTNLMMKTNARTDILYYVLKLKLCYVTFKCFLKVACYSLMSHPHISPPPSSPDVFKHVLEQIKESERCCVILFSVASQSAAQFTAWALPRVHTVCMSVCVCDAVWRRANLRNRGRWWAAVRVKAGVWDVSASLSVWPPEHRAVLVLR